LEWFVAWPVIDRRVRITDRAPRAEIGVAQVVVSNLVLGIGAVELIAVRLFVCIAVHDVEQTDCNCDEALQLGPIELRKNARHGWNAWRTRRMM
jgi:hypothetical protein